jgi:acetylornithine deacetylase/succinyl-diaminopimelate desuccinylase-like protein
MSTDLANASVAADVLERIQPDELAELTRDLVDIPSPTGAEREIAEFVLGWFDRHGIRTIRQQIDENRLNAIGIVEGDATGASLMINGHMDTSFTGSDSEDAMFAERLEPVADLAGSIRDGTVYGLGASNMKCGLAAFMVAGKALKESGAALRGDLVLAAVAGEISRTPIDEHQSGRYRGEGMGTRHLIAHGVQADYAICADGSALQVISAQAGVAQFKITTFGDPHAAWGVTRDEEPTANVNAIIRAMAIVEAIEGWAASFERDHVFASAVDGPLIPKVNVGAIVGGAPFRPNYHPGRCSLYVDVRLPPELRPMAVQRRLRTLIAAVDERCVVEMYRSQMGYEAPAAAPVARALGESYAALYDEPPPPVTVERASIWTDMNVLNEMGIPCCKFGPRGKRWAVRSEQVEVDEIVRAAKVYALTALDVCGWDAPDTA